MAFKKNGDEMPILSVMYSEGEEIKCPKCGDLLVIIAMNDEENKLVCESCDINTEDE